MINTNVQQAVGGMKAMSAAAADMRSKLNMSDAERRASNMLKVAISQMMCESPVGILVGSLLPTPGARLKVFRAALAETLAALQSLPDELPTLSEEEIKQATEAFATSR